MVYYIENNIEKKNLEKYGEDILQINMREALIRVNHALAQNQHMIKITYPPKKVISPNSYKMI